MNAILLCAGYATRLYPLTKNQPKPLLPVAGRPILEWILEQVKPLPGLKEVFVVTNHRFAAHFEAWACGLAYPWPIVVVDDQTVDNDHRLGAIGDLAYVLKEKKIGREDLLVLAGDNLFDFDLRRFLKYARRKEPHPSLVVYNVGDYHLAKRYGIVRLTEEGRLLEFLEKPSDPPTTLASCGIYWLPAETRLLLDRYLADGHNADQPGHYMRWLVAHDSLFACPLEGRWLDIGDHASYEKANALLQGISKVKEERKKIP